MKTGKEKIQELNEQIKIVKEALRGDGSVEAREWTEKYLIKLNKKREKLIEIEKKQ